MGVRPRLKAGGPPLAGIARKLNPYLGSPGLLKCRGFHFDEQGALTKWQGFSKLNTTQLLEGGVPATFTGLFEYAKSDGTRFKLATTTKGLYRLDGSVWVPLTLPAGYVWSQSPGDQTDFAVLRDILYITGTGSQQNLKFDGTNVRLMGIVPPATAPLAQATTLGNLTPGATYRYKITFYNSIHDHESNPSPEVEVVLSGTQNAVTLTNIPVSTDAQVTRRRIYRTTANGVEFQFLDEINDNATTTFTDTHGDLDLAEALEETENGVPPRAEMFALFKGILFMVPPNSSRVWFSKLGFPNAVDGNDFRDLDPNDGTVITAIQRLYQDLVVFKGHSIWLGVGEDRTTFGFNRVVNEVGARSHKGVVVVPGRSILLFPSDEGFYSFNSTSENYESGEIEPEFEALSADRLDEIVAVAHRRRNLLLWFCTEGPGSKNNYVIAYDYVGDKWTTRPLPATPAYVAGVFMDENGQTDFYIGGDTGYVWKGDSGLSDDGQSFEAEIIDRCSPKQAEAILDDSLLCFYEFVVRFKPQAGSFLDVYASVDEWEGPTANYVLIGTIDMGDPRGQATLRKPFYGHRLFLRFVNTATNQPVTIRSWTVEYKNLGRSRRS